MARCSNCHRNEGDTYTESRTDTIMVGQDSYDSQTSYYVATTGKVRRCVDCNDWFCTGCMVGDRCYECKKKYEKK